MAQTVSDFLINRLKCWDVHRIDGYPCAGINGIMGALERAKDDPRFIRVGHEEMAAFMARAHGRFTGEVGVCLATCWNSCVIPKCRPCRRTSRWSRPRIS